MDDLVDLYTTLTEQSQELMAAKTLDSNLYVAYQLQMQEAINASLALHNPAAASSSRTPPHPNPRTNDDDDIVFIPQSLDDDILDIATALMLEDMYRFAQELDDREKSEAEMRKMKEDLDRRIHDKKPAADIFNIPDQQWEKDGHNFHCPYHATTPSSSSSSKDLVDSECFRLYFKGLVSEEMVKGMMVNVAGAGVAICDSRDNLILESRKNLEALVNGAVENSKIMNSKVAEIQTLVEALTVLLKL